MSIVPRHKRALVSGASIAGPAAAYWLHRYGFEVTVVERAANLRASGYPIDIRGAAMVVAGRMGMTRQLRSAHIDTRSMTFVDETGAVSASITPGPMTDAGGTAVELPRGELVAMLFALTRDTIDYRFGQSIVALDDRPEGVSVTFNNGMTERFDLVIAADGLHSNTRKLVFGLEAQFTHDIGYCFAGFTVPNEFGLDHEGVIWNAPGRMATLYAAGGQNNVHGLLAVANNGAVRHPEEQRQLIRQAFAGNAWHIPKMLTAMDQAKDCYFDTMQQVRMPTWHKGRVVLVGDAAYCPSFLTGQGTSMALAGAYVLACELARHEDHAAAFDAYAQRLRPFVLANQATVNDGQAMLIPTSAEQLRERNAALQQMPTALGAVSQSPSPGDALELRDYENLVDAHR